MTPVTSFSYDGTTVTMEVNPLHPRSWEEAKDINQQFDSTGEPYTYDTGTPIARTEALTFPAISYTNLADLQSFIEGVVYGRQYPITWVDRLGVSRQARYAGMSYKQVSPNYYQVILTLEVLT